MSLITLVDVSIRFRGPALLDGVNARIEPGQRIGLLGRNGAGKTTLMRLLAGELQTDTGRVEVDKGAKICRLVQDVPRDLQGSVQQIVRSGFPDDSMLEPWERTHQTERIIEQMSLDGSAEFASLSSGMKRRVLLAQSLVAQPAALLLDEPTNHLDLDSILWLESFLMKWPGTLLFVTHDRAFLQRLANRIWELDRGRLFDWSCDYNTFLQRKEAALEAEEKQAALFDKKLAQEEAWIRTGIKARRTRNEGRVRALKAMRAERAERRKAEGQVRLEMNQANRSGTLVASLRDVTFGYGDQPLVRNFSATIIRGDKIGIIGPNGAGKSTLLKLILGQLQPQAGTVQLGTNLQIAYFDQLRDQLENEKTALDSIGEGSDRVQINGQTKHVLGYLQDFLFSPDRARTLVKFLSGGERNRLLLAKLMTKPANVLVLDEPTNDLDSETLDLLESLLVEFTGTILVVSHDRTFLNHVVSSTIVYEADGLHEYVGGYDDWQRSVARRADAAQRSNENKRSESTTAKPQSQKSSAPARRKLGYKEQRELENLPLQIEAWEQEIKQLHAQMAEGEYFKQASAILTQDQQRLQQLQASIEQAYARWEELETLVSD